MADRAIEFAQTVAFVSFGVEHKKMVHDMGHECEANGSKVFFYDVRSALTKDPSRTIGHKENGNCPQTQVTVISQSGFERVCKDIIQDLWNEPTKQILVLVMCQHGFHRSDTSARMCNALANYVFSRNTVEGQHMRVYNSKIFNSGEQYGKRGHIVMLENVKKWLEPGMAWELTDGGEQPYSQLYACKACRDDFEAYKTWKNLWDWIHAEYHKVRVIGPAQPARPPQAEAGSSRVPRSPEARGRKTQRTEEAGKGAGKGDKDPQEPMYSKGAGKSSAWRPAPPKGPPPRGAYARQAEQEEESSSRETEEELTEEEEAPSISRGNESIDIE